MKKDALTKFIFEKLPVRGAIIQLDDAWLTLKDRKNYPQTVLKQLGEFIAANVLLSSSLKLDGSLIMQIQGNGAINFMVMECTSEKNLRGMAQYSSEVENTEVNSLFEIFGDGQLALTIDNNKSNERYQSIVELSGDKISHALENYLHQSEQLQTKLILAMNDERAAGILVQKLPGSNNDDDVWNRISQLTATLSQDELITLPPEEILHRLFNEDDLRILASEKYQFKCSCSLERVTAMIVGLGEVEVNSILKEQGAIDIDCEFCNQHYSLDKIDAKALFTSNSLHSPSETRH